MKAKDKRSVSVRVTPAEKVAIEKAAREARQAEGNYALQAIEERVKREGKEWPEVK
ncbi:MAG: hypothetical protein WC683_15795 [bacterium]